MSSILNNLRTGYFDTLKEINKKVIKRSNQHLFKKHLQETYPATSEIEDKIYEDFAEKIQNVTISMPKGHVFSDADLVIFKDDYQGHLPLNGILRSNFLKAEKLYQDLISEKTVAKFFIKSSPEFIEQIHYDLRILFSRQISRDLIAELTKGPNDIFIIVGDEAKHFHTEIYNKEYGFVLIPQNSIPSNIVQASNEKNFFLSPDPRFLILFHELIHEYYSQKKENYPGIDLDDGYTNQDEKMTIRGIDAFAVLLEKGGFNIHHVFDYRRFNEWTLCSVFGIIPRNNHLTGGIFPPEENPNAEDKDGYTPLHYAIAVGADLDVASLLKRGADPNAKSKMGETPLWESILNKKFLIAEMLLEKGADPSLSQQRGETIYQLIDEEYLKEKNLEVKKKLLEIKDLIFESTFSDQNMNGKRKSFDFTPIPSPSPKRQRFNEKQEGL